MVVSYLMTGILFAMCCTALWIITGGTVLSAILVYILSGNIAVAAMVTGTMLFGKKDSDD